MPLLIIAELRRLLLNQQNTTNVGRTARVAKTKHVELPAYKGERAMYVSWKENMKAYLDISEIPEQFRGHFIYDSLKGEPKEYIGEGESWLNREEELWTRLDSKYADKWSMTAELVKQTMCTEVPTGGPELDKYLEQMVNQLRKVKRTQMPAEQLAAQKLLLDLPRKKANELRAALRILKGI